MRAVVLILLSFVGCTDNRRVLRDAGPDAPPPDLDSGGEPRCGDGVRQGAEVCDGSDLGGASCEALGLGSGTLACDACTFDASGCESCVPSCEGRECGGDGCGGSCGACDEPESCSAGLCTCTPACAGRECGPDGCGGSCGTCAAGETCGASGTCGCVPQCSGLECGDDGCGGSCGECAGGERCEAGACVSARGELLLSEVFYNAVGGDDLLEWVEIYNAGSRAIDLSGFSIGAGGADYTYSVYPLSGTIPPGGCWVVGGTVSSSANGFPSFAQSADFSPDLQNSGASADGVALFAVPAASITETTVPIDAVIYGSGNTNGLVDETGIAGAVDVGDAGEGKSIERTTSGWRIQAFPSPNDCLL